MIWAFETLVGRKPQSHTEPLSFSHILWIFSCNLLTEMTLMVIPVLFVESSNNPTFGLYFINIGMGDVEIVSSRSRAAATPWLLDILWSGKVAKVFFCLSFLINILIIFSIWHIEYWICGHITVTHLPTFARFANLYCQFRWTILTWTYSYRYTIDWNGYIVYKYHLHYFCFIFKTRSPKKGQEWGKCWVCHQTFTSPPAIL